MGRITEIFEEYVCTINLGERQIDCYGPFETRAEANSYYNNKLRSQYQKKFDAATLNYTHKIYPFWLKSYMLSKSFKIDKTNIIKVSE